jgi:hypothetical protein
MDVFCASRDEQTHFIAMYRLMSKCDAKRSQFCNHAGIGR